jgi:hypothetical protein
MQSKNVDYLLHLKHGKKKEECKQNFALSLFLETIRGDCHISSITQKPLYG